MINLDELNKIWDNLPEAVKIDILGYITALLNDTKQVPEDLKSELEQRLEKYKTEKQSAISWGYLYNQLIKEII